MPRPRLAADADVRPMRTAISSLRRKLGDAADNPTYIFNEPRVGYRMPKGEAKGSEESEAEALLTVLRLYASHYRNRESLMR